MLARVQRGLIWLTHIVHDPASHPGAFTLSRRMFTRALAVVAFGGLVRPASARLVSDTVCDCDHIGQCTGDCEPWNGFSCPDIPQFPDNQGANCWCVPGGDGLTLICDCHCPTKRWKFCECRTDNSDGCLGGGGGQTGHHPGGKL